MNLTEVLIIRLLRETYTAQTTLGRLYLDGQFFGFTLEDTVRAHGIKVPWHTAIPAFLYRVKLSYSNKFQRIMPLVYNQPDGSIRAMGVHFAGIRFHGGNRHTDTSGCILVARNRISDTVIQGSLEQELTAALRLAVRSGKAIQLEVING